MNYHDIVVVGCGLSGATSARLLAEQGYKVLVVEQKKHIGGQVYDFRNEHGITLHCYGPHIFHTKLKHVWDFVNRFTEFSNFQHRVLSFVEGNFVPFPINRLTLNQIFGEHLKTKDVSEFLQQEVFSSEYDSSLASFRDAVVSQVGERLYALFFEKYTEKQWNCNPETLSSELAGRIPVRNNNDCRYFSDKYQGIPVNGYTAMINNMLEHENIHLLLGCNYENIKEQLSAKLFVYTGELDKFFGYKFGKLAYRSVKIVFKTYEQELFQSAPVVNYPNDYDYTRITEFKQMTEEKSAKTTVCFEYPSAEGLPFYTVPNKENNLLREQYMQEVKQLEMTGKYLFIGRLAEYKYYNMDLAIESAMKRIGEWVNR
jgi:UDP-galactopyranose mutase